MSDTVESEVQEEKREHGDVVDFKMVTFSLAGKEYGIDIMNVKEIANAGRFTYVPNAAPFVRGVYNLRGDIISIIDLRTMFHLPAERKNDDSLESLLILRVNESAFGVIVDNIDKVVGVSSRHIQPPHPIFGDINVKYIKGIIENNKKLYIILNVEKLFSNNEDSNKNKASTISVNSMPSPVREVSTPIASSFGAENNSSNDINKDFVKEALFTFRHFGVSSVNDEWFKQRYNEWVKIREATDIQLKIQSDAEQYLENFYSQYTGELWSEEYGNAVVSALPKIEAKSINVWNPGCGKGYETYSFVVALKRAYPNLRVKIWANDSDLLAISMAPNMVFTPESIPEAYLPVMTKGKNGWVFQQEIRDSIFFEFHDVLNANPVPPVDLILCRDTVSFLAVQDQNKILSDMVEKAKSGSAIILGKNEKLPLDGWEKVGPEDLSVFVNAQ